MGRVSDNSYGKTKVAAFKHRSITYCDLWTETEFKSHLYKYTNLDRFNVDFDRSV